MAWRAMLLTAVLGMAGCSVTPQSLGITGPGLSGPPTFVAAPADDDAAVTPAGLPATNSVYSPSLQPAGDAAKPNSFYGYN
jgi:hypothetical protein